MLFQKLKSLFQTKRQIIKNGTIKFINRRRGYGFIHSNSTTKDVFVHITDLKDRVSKGDLVQFELIFSPEGLQAKHVQLAEN